MRNLCKLLVNVHTNVCMCIGSVSQNILLTLCVCKRHKWSSLQNALMRNTHRKCTRTIDVNLPGLLWPFDLSNSQGRRLVVCMNALSVEFTIFHFQYVVFSVCFRLRTKNVSLCLCYSTFFSLVFFRPIPNMCMRFKWNSMLHEFRNASTTHFSILHLGTKNQFKYLSDVCMCV